MANAMSAMTGAAKHRACAKCGQQRMQGEFVRCKNSIFQPMGYSLICIDCLEKLVAWDDLAQVDKLCQWLDIPFIVDVWTQIGNKARERTLSLYIKAIGQEKAYDALDWRQTNAVWRNVLNAHGGNVEEHVAGVAEQWMRDMKLKWPSETERSADDYHYLENLYNDVVATQNLVTATQRDDAKRLCELGLLINQKIRAGLDAKNEMAMYHNIIKTEGFEPKNSKNVGDFDTVSELVLWLEKRGWKPDWHVEPQDSADFTISELQSFTKRLIEGESGLADRVEARREQEKLNKELEDQNITYQEYQQSTQLNEIEYEGNDNLMDELGDDHG